MAKNTAPPASFEPGSTNARAVRNPDQPASGVKGPRAGASAAGAAESGAAPQAGEAETATTTIRPRAGTTAGVKPPSTGPGKQQKKATIGKHKA